LWLSLERSHFGSKIDSIVDMSIKIEKLLQTQGAAEVYDLLRKFDQI
jgi:hypothetical protein